MVELIPGAHPWLYADAAAFADSCCLPKSAVKTLRSAETSQTEAS